MRPGDDIDAQMREPVGAAELDDFRKYVLLRQKRNARGLARSELKRYMRLRTRLIKGGVIKQVSQDTLRDRARLAYMALPWWRRWAMRMKFRWAMLKRWWAG